jgi:hypothetical protein
MTQRRWPWWTPERSRKLEVVPWSVTACRREEGAEDGPPRRTSGSTSEGGSLRGPLRKPEMGPLRSAALRAENWAVDSTSGVIPQATEKDSAISRALRKRSSGSLARARWNHASRPTGSPARRCEGGRGLWVVMATISSPTPSDSKGT